MCPIEIRSRFSINWGNTLGNHGPRAKIVVEDDSESPPSTVTLWSREPRLSPNDARPIRMVPPSSSNTVATDSMARRARTTPALGS